jgi:hypothetical protein
MFDLRSQLLGPAQMSRKIFMYLKISNFLNQSAGRAGRIQFILAQNTAVCNTEILHQLLFGIMSN